MTALTAFVTLPGSNELPMQRVAGSLTHYAVRIVLGRPLDRFPRSLVAAGELEQGRDRLRPQFRTVIAFEHAHDAGDDVSDAQLLRSAGFAGNRV